jgi:hypothetical protein
MSRTILVGAHSVTREASGLLLVRYVGDLSGNEMTSMYDAIELLADGKKDILTINDLSRMGEISGGARKMVGNDPRSGLFGAVAVYGASFTARIISNMTIRAARVLGVGIRAPIVFFESEPQARAWIEEIMRERSRSSA